MVEHLGDSAMSSLIIGTNHNRHKLHKVYNLQFHDQIAGMLMYSTLHNYGKSTLDYGNDHKFG